LTIHGLAQYRALILGACRKTVCSRLKRESGDRLIAMTRIPELPRSGNWERTARIALGSTWEAAPSRSVTGVAEAHESEDLPRIAR
jgi:hypothetical protein